MTNNRYNIQFFYRHEEGNNQGLLTVAFDESGKKRWEEMSENDRITLGKRVIAAFEAPYYPGATDTPRGRTNVKEMFQIREDIPEGQIQLGDWWDAYMKPGEYYKKRGWESVSIEENFSLSKESKK